jgi:hypothetical protein
MKRAKQIKRTFIRFGRRREAEHGVLVTPFGARYAYHIKPIAFDPNVTITFS